MILDEVFAKPRISSFFPLVHDNGARWTKQTASCNDCKQPMRDEDVRGEVTHPFPRVYVIDGHGLCRPCAKVWPIRYRLYDDMSMTGRSPEDGAWSRWDGRPSWWARLVLRIFGTW